MKTQFYINYTDSNNEEGCREIHAENEIEALLLFYKWVSEFGGKVSGVEIWN